MPRRPRNYMKSSFFHIVVKGIEKRYIFDNDKDKKKYIRLMEKNNDEIENIAYCIMSNHAHMLIKVDDVKLMEKWMHKVNSNYAKYYNKKYEKVGYVFNNRYYSQEILNEKHLFRCIKYIHDNPVKAGMCDRPENYYYSTYKTKYNASMKNISNELSRILGIKSDEYTKETVFEKYELIFIDSDISRDEICNNFLTEIEKEYKIDVKNIKNNDILLDVLKVLKVNLAMSYRKLEAILGIGRETIRKIVKENEGKW